MDISVTDFKAHCLDLIRKVEEGGKSMIAADKAVFLRAVC